MPPEETPPQIFTCEQHRNIIQGLALQLQGVSYMLPKTVSKSTRELAKSALEYLEEEKKTLGR